MLRLDLNSWVREVSPASAFWIAGTRGVHHHTQLNIFFEQQVLCINYLTYSSQWLCAMHTTTTSVLYRGKLRPIKVKSQFVFSLFSLVCDFPLPRLKTERGIIQQLDDHWWFILAVLMSHYIHKCISLFYTTKIIQIYLRLKYVKM